MNGCYDAMYSSNLKDAELHTDHTQMLFSSLASCLRHCNVLPDVSASMVGIWVQFLVVFHHPMQFTFWVIFRGLI